MYNNARCSERTFNPHTAESLADVLYEMGKDLLHSQQYPMAIKWLERAYEILSSQELDRLSFDASELRISILQSSVKAQLGLKDGASLEKARSLVDFLESELGDKLVVLLLKLEVISANEAGSFDVNSYGDTIRRMIRTITLSDSNFRLIMFHIRKLNDQSPSLACGALEDLMQLRISKEDREDWLEKVLITRLWVSISQKGSPEDLVLLEQFFTKVLADVRQSLSTAATLAAHTVGKPSL